MPQDKLEIQYFVALNTYYSPGDATNFSDWANGELAPEDKKGEFSNGENCGRWVKVTLGPDCDGINDGALGEDFCRGANAQWIDDQYSGAELYLIVADACPDGNAWCRDSYFHLDMSEVSVSKFEKNGTAVGNDIFDHFNNRTINWEYVKAPNYAGDIAIYMMKNAQTWWPAIGINNLENGIHNIDQWIGGQWVDAEMNGTMGQSFVLDPDNGAGTYTIRIYDADDKLVKNGRQYSFSLPAGCTPCSDAVTEVAYTTFDPTPIKTAISVDTVFFRSEFEEIGDTLALLNRGQDYTHTLSAGNDASFYQWKDGALLFSSQIPDTKNTVTKHSIELIAENSDYIVTYSITIFDALDYYTSTTSGYVYSETAGTSATNDIFEATIAPASGSATINDDFRIITGTTNSFPSGTIFLWDAGKSAKQKGLDAIVASIVFKDSINGHSPIFPLRTKYYKAIETNVGTDSIFGEQPQEIGFTVYTKGHEGTGNLWFPMKMANRPSRFPITPDTTIMSQGIYFNERNFPSISAFAKQDIQTLDLELKGIFSSLEKNFGFTRTQEIDSIEIVLSATAPSFGGFAIPEFSIDTTMEAVHEQQSDLIAGWNLVTLQIDIDSCDIPQIFPNAEQVKNDDYFFDASLPEYLNTLSAISPGMPYLVKNKISEKLTFSGIYIPNQTSALKPGWNLFSGPIDRPWDIVPLGQVGTYLIKDFSGFGNSLGAGDLHATTPGKAYFFYSEEHIVKHW